MVGKEQVRDEVACNVKVGPGVMSLCHHVIPVPVPVHVCIGARVCVAPVLIDESLTAAFRN